MNERAEHIKVARAGCVLNRTRAEEQETLEQRMVEGVKDRGGRCDRGRRIHPVGLEGKRQTKPDENDPDILDRRIGEQLFQIVLHQCEQSAKYGRDAAEDQDQRPPPPAGRSQKIEGDADETVNRHLGHDAAHQRGNVTRRRRMRGRQPDMQRHEAGLGARADQCQQESDGCGERC